MLLWTAKYLEYNDEGRLGKTGIGGGIGGPVLKAAVWKIKMFTFQIVFTFLLLNIRHERLHVTCEILSDNTRYNVCIVY